MHFWRRRRSFLSNLTLFAIKIQDNEIFRTKDIYIAEEKPIIIEKYVEGGEERRTAGVEAPSARVKAIAERVEPNIASY